MLQDDVPNAEAKARTLATLKQMKGEAEQAFRRYRRTLGLPDPTA